MKDGRPETMRDCLRVMEDSDGSLGDEKWKALSFFLASMAESQGVDLDCEVRAEPAKGKA